MNFFKKNKFDWLFVACEDKLLTDFEPLLHSYLKEKLKGRIKAKITDSVEKIKQETIDLETKLKKEAEDQTVQRLVAELELGGQRLLA